MSNEQGGPTTARPRALVVNWDIRSAIETVLRIHDALAQREGQSIPMHPEEIAHMLQLKDALDKATKYALRRCLCNKVFCRSPEKDKPCVLNVEDALRNPQLVADCKYRGKLL